jgi:UDP-N-acetylmuramate--alanine ligase
MRQPTFGRIRHIHMVGIGGIGMSSIAQVLLARGFHVSGSDAKKSEVTDALEALGATIHEGHAAEHVGGADVVVYSSAVRRDENPETVEARQRRLPLIKRSIMLAELMRMKYGIGIAGTHGKTTTTSMAGLVCAEAGFDPTVIVGGKVAAFGSNAVAGEGDVIVIEADEYDRTFLRLTPVFAVVTNIEADHLDIYRDLDDIREAFTQFVRSVPFFGAAIVCLDDPGVQSILPGIDRRLVTYGTARQADVRAENVRRDNSHTAFDVVVRGERAGTVHLSVPGLHNVRNALAAVTVGLEMDVPFETIAAAIARFTGVERRFERVGEAQGVLVVDDYAHHPTEVAATLEAAASGYPERRLVLVFQPHLYSRTRDFVDEFAHAFLGADVLVLTDIYAAREAPVEGIDGETLVEAARRHGHRDVHYVPDKAALPVFLAGLARDGDLVLTMGAGDIHRAGRALLERLNAA